MENILRNISLRKRDIYILGDFNINLLNSDTHSNTSDFIDMMFATSFLPLINRPTRISDNSATLIDSGRMMIKQSVHYIENTYCLSDHCQSFQGWRRCLMRVSQT